MRTIYLDESGYTGSNYLDAHQPIFALASLAIEPEEAEELKAKFFGTAKSKELKHSSLVKRPRHRERVLRYLEYLAGRPAITKTWLIDKNFAAWLKVVDHLIEPAIYAQGGNLYDQGANVALATLFHRCVPGFTKPEVNRVLLERAIDLMKNGENSRRVALLEWIDFCIQEFPHPRVEEVLDHLRNPLRFMPPQDFSQPIPNVMDLAYPAALHLMAWWRTDIADPIRLVHDATADMARRRDVWDAITSADLDPDSFPSASAMQLTYPISVAETHFVKSTASPGVQLADILAGAATSIGSGQETRQDYARSVAHFLGRMEVHAILPPDDITPAGMGTKGIDGADHLNYLVAQHVAGRIPEPMRKQRKE